MPMLTNKNTPNTFVELKININDKQPNINQDIAGYLPDGYHDEYPLIIKIADNKDILFY